MTSSSQATRTRAYPFSPPDRLNRDPHDAELRQRVYVLLTHPEELARLRSDPALLPTAVKELMRFIPLGVASAFSRYAPTDVELGGVVVRAGEPVITAIASADQDEAVSAAPGRLDLGRSPNPHLGFGHGAHHCLGAQLARMELQVALAALLDRMPNLRLAVSESDLAGKSGSLVRGLTRLPVAR